MVIIREEETICAMFNYYVYTLKVKLNTNWQIVILFKIICIINKIISIIALNLVDNFWLCKKHLYFLAKKIRFITKNILLGDLGSWLGEIWKK